MAALLKTYWYRAEGGHYAAPLDEFDRPCGSSTPFVRIDEYEVIKTTPKGAWIRVGFDERRFVLRVARKRWACPTKKEALESFMARKDRQINIYQARIRRWQGQRELAEGMMNRHDILG